MVRYLKTEDEIHDFYKWLLWRAEQEELDGNDNFARIYREYAEAVKQELLSYH